MFEYEVPDYWYDNCYKDRGKIISAARSFSSVSGKDRAVLLVHGYQGYPGELVRPSRDLAPNFDVYVPRLPGMGTTGDDFSACSYKDWLLLIDNALSDLCSRYKEVFLLGHSMGALISLALVNRHDVKKLVLACPAFEPIGITKNDMLKLNEKVKRIEIEWKADPRYRMYYENAPKDDEIFAAHYWRYLNTDRILDLYTLSEIAQVEALKLKSETLILTAEKDGVVSNKVDKYFNDKAIIRNLTFATHFLFYDIDKVSEHYAVDEVLSFLL